MAGGALTGSAFLSGCNSESAPGQTVFMAAEWNLQALFDGDENGSEYGEFSESAGWSAEKYRARINAISQAILQMAHLPVTQEGTGSKTSVPDLIGFIELENSTVLKDLAGGNLFKHGYSWTAFAAMPGASLGIGFLSRYPILETKAHSISSGKETAPRPVLEVRIEPGGKPLVFLLCHWKSKLGGEEATEELRRASARVVQRRLRELRESERETPVIVMGDLNENHDEFYRRSYLCALLPDDPDAASMAHNDMMDFLVLSREKPPIASFFPEEIPVLYSPWEEELSEGSYFYKDEWETIDHILFSEGLFDGSGWEFDGCRVLNQAPFTGSGGAPDRYNPKNGMGLSDHLPLLLYLKDLTGK